MDIENLVTFQKSGRSIGTALPPFADAYAKRSTN